MKTQTLKFTTLLALLATALLLANCKGEPSCPDEGVSYNYLGTYERLRIPYIGFDTIRYTDNNGNEKVYIGNGIKQRFSDIRTRDPNPDCNVYQTEKFEVLQFSFLSKVNRDSLFLQVEDNNGTCTFIGNNCIFYFTIFSFKDLESRIDSIFLNSKWYYNQSLLTNASSDTLIINKEFGILKCTNYSLNKQITIN